jgi:AAA family ATP:ADP antiporter
VAKRESRIVTNLAARLLNFRRGELPLALLSALFYFCVLCGYFFLRPVREAMGVSRGMDDLRWLFIGSSIASLVAVLLFGGVVSRFDRRRFIPIAYLFVIVCLIGFSALLIADALGGGGLIGTDTGTTFALVVAYTFFIWLTVINLFVNSLFWAFMVDLFNVDQGKRMFAFIGIGGTLGAIVGGWSTNVVSGMTESVYLPPGLMLIGATLFGGAILTMLTLDRLALRSEQSQLRTASGKPAKHAAAGAKVGGSFWDGATAIARSPYLLGISLFILFLAISKTLLYFTQANIILDNADTFSQRVGSFAQFDMLAQIATLISQVFITTHLIKRLGVGWTLAILPLVTVAGFAVLAVWPVYGVMAMFQAIHRATDYAATRPARETLFSVVPAAEKYKAKPMIDVFVYRFGDVAGAGFDSAMRVLGFSLLGVTAATVPLAALWCVLSLALARTQQKLNRERAPENPRNAAPIGAPLRVSPQGKQP